MVKVFAKRNNFLALITLVLGGWLIGCQMEQPTASNDLAVDAESTELRKSPNDSRDYRYLRLPNQMRVLLVSDPVMDPDEAEDEYYSEYLGSQSSVRDLPWIDVEQTLFIICNRSPGADVGIALDYRSGKDSPRVIGGDWHSGGNCIYREISPSFDAFVELLGLRS